MISSVSIKQWTLALLAIPTVGFGFDVHQAVSARDSDGGIVQSGASDLTSLGKKLSLRTVSKGVIVAEARSMVPKFGVLTGDIITSIDGRSVQTPEDVFEVIRWSIS